MKFWKDWEDAVSPVIGTILMVAVTVILAAVIAAFVFGWTGPLQRTKSVGATATQQGTAIVITYQGGQDQNQVSAYGLNVSILSSDGNAITYPGAGQMGLEAKVGNITRFGGGTSGQDHVTVTAAFTDGSQQVILDSYV